MALEGLRKNLPNANLPLVHALQKLRVSAEVQLRAAFRAGLPEGNFTVAARTFHAISLPYLVLTWNSLPLPPSTMRSPARTRALIPELSGFEPASVP